MSAADEVVHFRAGGKGICLSICLSGPHLASSGRIETWWALDTTQSKGDIFERVWGLKAWGG